MSDDGNQSAAGVTPALTPEQAQRVLRRNVQNLVEKVKQGKLLSSSEQALVESLALGSVPGAVSSKAFASDQVELAAILGVNRKTIQRWRAEGAPEAQSDGRWDVKAYRVWMATNGKKGGEDDGGGAPSKTQLEAKRLLLMNEKLEFEISILRGEYTKNEEVAKQAAAMYVEAKKVLLAVPDALAPQVVGLTVAEAAKRLRESIDDALLRLHTGTTTIHPAALQLLEILFDAAHSVPSGAAVVDAKKILRDALDAHSP